MTEAELKMFDIRECFLVFETQCVDIYDQHTGYIFNWYEPGEVKVQELFFSHVFEAQQYAKKRGAVFVLNPAAGPRRVSIEEFLHNHDTGSFGRCNWDEQVHSHMNLGEVAEAVVGSQGGADD